MKFQNCILINFERTDGRTSPKQYAPSPFLKIEMHMFVGTRVTVWKVPTIDGQWNKFHQKFLLIMTIPLIRHLGGTSLHLPVLRHTTTEEPDRS